MNLRNRIITWLDLPEIEDYSDELMSLHNEIAKLTERIDTIVKVKCYVCKKSVIAGRNALYTDYKGRKFCSHECIDVLSLQEKKDKKK